MTVRSLSERLLSVAVYSVVGVLVGTIGTLTHRARIDVLGITLWQGVVIAILCVACVGIGLRMYLPERWVSYGYGAGVIGSIVCLAMLRPGGSVLVTDDLVSLAWLIVPSVVVAGVIAWPDVRRADAREDRAEAGDGAGDGAGGAASAPAASAPAASVPVEAAPAAHEGFPAGQGESRS